MDLRKKKNAATIATAAMILCAMVVLGVGMFKVIRSSSGNGPSKPTGGNTSAIPIDQAAVDGPLPGFTASTQKNDENTFSYRICEKPYFKKADSKGELCIENPAENQYLMSVDIQLDAGGVVYSSDLLRPNQHIQEAPLRKELAKGTHPATAIIYAWTQDGGEVVGQLEQKVTLYVGKKPQ